MVRLARVRRHGIPFLLENARRADGVPLRARPARRRIFHAHAMCAAHRADDPLRARVPRSAARTRENDCRTPRHHGRRRTPRLREQTRRDRKLHADLPAHAPLLPVRRRRSDRPLRREGALDDPAVPVRVRYAAVRRGPARIQHANLADDAGGNAHSPLLPVEHAENAAPLAMDPSRRRHAARRRHHLRVRERRRRDRGSVPEIADPFLVAHEYALPLRDERPRRDQRNVRRRVARGTQTKRIARGGRRDRIIDPHHHRVLRCAYFHDLTRISRSPNAVRSGARRGGKQRLPRKTRGVRRRLPRAADLGHAVHPRGHDGDDLLRNPAEQHRFPPDARERADRHRDGRIVQHEQPRVPALPRRERMRTGRADFRNG